MVETTNDLVLKRGTPATLHGWYWAVCLGLLVGFLAVAPSREEQILLIASLFAAGAFILLSIVVFTHHYAKTAKRISALILVVLITTIGVGALLF